MSEQTATQLKKDQFVLLDIPEYPEGFALGVIKGVKVGNGYFVRILVPEFVEGANPRDIFSDDLISADADTIRSYYNGWPTPFNVIVRDSECFFGALSRHEFFQICDMEFARFHFPDLEEDSTIPEVIKRLIESGMNVQATELMFGCRRDTGDHKLESGVDKFNWTLFMSFWTGRIPRSLFLRIANRHYWTTSDKIPFDKGYPIDVFENEVLFIPDPEAYELLRMFMSQ